MDVGRILDLVGSHFNDNHGLLSDGVVFSYSFLPP